jgi:hypothetical protein
MIPHCGPGREQHLVPGENGAAKAAWRLTPFSQAASFFSFL